MSEPTPDTAPDAPEAEAINEAAPGKLVPVTEAIRYRKRAQAAEQEAGDLTERMHALERELAETRETIDHLERRQRIDALLTESDAIDLDAARLLTEVAVSGMDEPDLAAAVADLRAHKPYLFRPSQRGGALMPPRLDATADPAESAAQRAVETGDRRDLLRYLRLRRKHG